MNESTILRLTEEDFINLSSEQIVGILYTVGASMAKHRHPMLLNILDNLFKGLGTSHTDKDVIKEVENLRGLLNSCVDDVLAGNYTYTQKVMEKLRDDWDKKFFPDDDE